MTGAITALKLQKNDKDRVNIFLDGEFAFAVTLDVAACLHKGQHLSDAEIDVLRTQDDLDKAYAAALHYLAARPRSRSEVERRLEQKGHAPEAIAAAIERLKDRCYVDDEAFAAFWVENRTRFRPRSAAAMRQELSQKGVDSDTIRQALDELDEDAAAWAALEGKLYRWHGLDKAEFERKVVAFLARRGFSFGLARRTAGRAWREAQAE